MEKEVLSFMGISVNVFFGFFTILSFLVLLLQLKKEPRTLRLGILAIWFLGNFVLSINFLLIYSHHIREIVIVEAAALIGFILLFPVVIILYLLYQTILIWLKERHTFSNFLLTIALISYIALTLVVGILNRSLPQWAQRMMIFIPLTSMYVSLTFLNFFFSSFIYGLYMLFKRKRAKALVILGGGLIDGRKVGRLLGNRIQAAIKYSQKIDQPEFIFSGGQGGDEKVSEAQAMQEYALFNGLSADTLMQLEDKSKNTRENLLFSSRILNGAEFTFFTSDYHVFRAALLAKGLGLKANGKGGKTPLYYRGTAFLREYIGIMVINKKRHIIALEIIVAISVLSMLSLLL